MKRIVIIQILLLFLFTCFGLISCLPGTHLIPPPKIEYRLTTSDGIESLHFDLLREKIDEDNAQLTFKYSNTGIEKVIIKKVKVDCDTSEKKSNKTVQINDDGIVLYPGEEKKLQIDISACSKETPNQLEIVWYYSKKNIHAESVCKIEQIRIVHHLWHDVDEESN